jgi:hypothetical protein
VAWCRKYLYLPRVSTDDVILEGLTNAQAALTGDSTFHLAETFDEPRGRFIGLRPQGQFQRAATMRMLIVKDEVALAQIEAEVARLQRQHQGLSQCATLLAQHPCRYGAPARQSPDGRYHPAAADRGQKVA